jgi:hypothetical protein
LENEVVQRAFPPLQPSQQALARFSHDLELNRTTGLLLNDGCPVANGPAADEIANAQLHQIAPAQLAVDGQVEQGSVAQPLVLIEVEPDGPNVARPQWSLGSHILPGVQGRRSCTAGSRSECPIASPDGQRWPGSGYAS